MRKRATTGDRSEQERKEALRRSIKRARHRPSERKRRAWMATIKLKYELTAHDIGLMWEKQHGACPICEQPLDSKRVWVIDHNHKTGAFRGLLHGWCNHRIVSMAERGGRTRARNVLKYLWNLDSENFSD